MLFIFVYMDAVFSGVLLIKKINYIIGLTWRGVVIYNGIEYNVKGPYHNWVAANISIFAYGLIDSDARHIQIETIIPDLLSQSDLFTVFLLSMNIKGLSKTRIDLLSNAFGPKLYSLFVENNFDLINTVLQYDEEKLAIIIKKWQEINAYCLLHIDLITLGLSAKSIKKVYKTYKENSIQIIKNNPYQMIEGIGFGFKTVDQIALESGIEKNNIIRIESGLLYILEENEGEGNTYILKHILYEKTKILLKIDDDSLIDISYNALIKKKKIINYENKYVGKYSTYEYESYLFQFLRQNQQMSISYNTLDNESHLSDEQKTAVLGAIKNKYSVITGSAGTGKSTVIKAIYNLQIENKKKIIVLTPTGRASQRIKEIDLSMETMTIYKALTPLSIYKILKNQGSQLIKYLEYDHIIIDECSMIDSTLLYVIFKMTHHNTQITFLGDSFQLPPIGIGNAFSLLIEYQVVPMYHLTKIFRQKENTVLLKIAKEVASGVYPRISNQDNTDCFFKEINKEKLNDFLKEYIDKYYNKESNILDLQCITFLNRGRCGVNLLNSLIQDYLHQRYRANEPLLLSRFYKYDKIVVLKNNYDLDIRNGELGIVIDGDCNQVIIQFCHDKIIAFSIVQTSLLALGYAINIYKSQGSEFKNVLVVLYMEQYILLNKKALYTALTRAKNKAIICGERKALYCAINSKNNHKRDTFLELWLKQ
jgi:exodeoxyribonuclease V alpha subunit